MMNKESLHKTALTFGIICFCLGVAGYLYPASSGDIPERIFYPSAGGQTVFTHKAHSKMSGLACVDCHHELLLANTVASCEKCHPDSGYTKDMLDHSDLVSTHFNDVKFKCSSCHETRKGEYRACRECHRQAAEQKVVSCEHCHEGMGFVFEDFAHDDLVAMESHQPCSKCHTSRGGADAVHTQCNRCHSTLKKGTFLEIKPEDDVSSSCKICHLGS
ncbi:cytochrome c3 family protein [bacterium]|nr:cytochrome c3 family protein [candidate division CSSED10-310 bacterium]